MDNLLFHYASHHNVLEKVVMYESEHASKELRSKVKSKDEIIKQLTRENLTVNSKLTQVQQLLCSQEDQNARISQMENAFNE